VALPLRSLLGDKSASSKANSLQQAGSEARDSASSLPPRSDATGLQQVQPARPYSDDESRCNIGSAAGERCSWHNAMLVMLDT
jgi:hypothetical protein